MAVINGIIKSSMKLQEKLNKRTHLHLKLSADTTQEGQQRTDTAVLTAPVPVEVI